MNGMSSTVRVGATEGHVAGTRVSFLSEAITTQAGSPPDPGLMDQVAVSPYLNQ